MRSMLALIIAVSAMIGLGAAQMDEFLFIDNLDEATAWMGQFSYENLMQGTPAYGVTWIHSVAESEPGWDFEHKYGPDNEDKAWTFTGTVAKMDDPTSSLNMWVDPVAKAGGSAASASGFGNEGAGWPKTLEYSVIEDGEQFTGTWANGMGGLSPALDNVAIASASGKIEATGIYQAWAPFVAETYTSTDEESSFSESFAGGIAWSDGNMRW